MNRADRLIDVVASQQNPTLDSSVSAAEGTCDSVTESPCAIGTVATRRSGDPVRLTLASRLGNELDGAWWPRTGVISRELPELVSVLESRLGQVIDINVNWSSLQRQPDLN